MLHVAQNNSSGMQQTMAEKQRENLLKRFAHIFARNPEFLLEAAKPDPDPKLPEKLSAAEARFNSERRRALKGQHTGSDARKKNLLQEEPAQEIPQLQAAEEQPVQSSKEKKKGKGKSSKEAKKVKAPGFNGDTSLSQGETPHASTAPSKGHGGDLGKGQHLSLGIQHSKDGVTKSTVHDAEENERRFEARLGQIMKVYETRVATLEKKHAKHLKTVEERLESSETIQSQLMKLNEKLAATSEHNLKLAALVLKRLPDQQQLLQTQSDGIMMTAMKQDEKNQAPGGSIAAAALAQGKAKR